MPSKHLPSWKFRNRAKATPAQLVVIRAQEAAKRRKARHRAYFLREYGRLPEGPDDERDVRRMMRGCPAGCRCYDCLFGPEECGPVPPRVARVVG